MKNRLPDASGSTPSPSGWISSLPDGSCRILVRAIPRASETCVSGIWETKLKIKVKSPPEDGRANKEICGFLAKLLGVPKRAVILVFGAACKEKTFIINGVSADEAAEKLLPRN